jgi:hypothetical protein
MEQVELQGLQGLVVQVELVELRVQVELVELRVQVGQVVLQELLVQAV